MSDIKVGDKVRQTVYSEFLGRDLYPTDPQPDEVGTVVSIDPARTYPYYVNFPRIDEGPWPFVEDEIEKVEA